MTDQVPTAGNNRCSHHSILYRRTERKNFTDRKTVTKRNGIRKEARKRI